MKGYVFTSDSIDSVHQAMRTGMFAVRIASAPQAFWPTIADFATVANKDLVFFFSKRFFFGVGRVAGPSESCCAFLNYDSAMELPLRSKKPKGEEFRVRGTTDAGGRIAVAFHPVGDWFEEGVDIDEVLGAPGSEVASSLRLMSGKSFHQLGHDEATWLATLILGRLAGRSTHLRQTDSDKAYWSRTLAHLRSGELRTLSIHDVVRRHPRHLVDSNQLLRLETVLHGLIVEHVRARGLRVRDKTAFASLRLLDTFHEYWGSPPKQAGDADRMDVLASYGLNPAQDMLHSIAPSALHVIEAKRHWLPGEQTAEKLVTQGLKYVDFLARRITAGDYGALALTIVLGKPTTRAWRGVEFQEEVRHELRRNGIRRYTVGSRTPGGANRTWENHSLLAYRWNKSAGTLDFEVIE